jgi:hypothetical protein
MAEVGLLEEVRLLIEIDGTTMQADRECPK